MKVSRKTANIMMIAGAVLGVFFFFALQFEFPRIAERLGNPPWLGSALTALILVGGILGALRLFRKRPVDRK